MPVIADRRYPKSFRDVLGARMAYIEVGDGDPIAEAGVPTRDPTDANAVIQAEGVGIA
jgi:hypothetical protein